MDIGFYCTDCWCPSPGLLRFKECLRVEKLVSDALRQSWAGPVTGVKGRQKGSVAEAESCTAKSQRFGRQSESIRGKGASGEQTARCRPKDLHLQPNPRHGARKKSGFPALVQRRFALPAMIPAQRLSTPIRAKTILTKGPAPMAQGQICGEKRIRTEGES